MCNDIEDKGKQLNLGGSLDRQKNRVILKTYFIKIVCRGSECGVVPLPFVSDNLGKRAMNDFVPIEIGQSFDIIFAAKPLTCRHFVEVADKFFCHGHRTVDGFNLCGVEFFSGFFIALQIYSIAGPYAALFLNNHR